jgi:murein DD-endopeptidase MepM/ murein hydrolase activator NlpD
MSTRRPLFPTCHGVQIRPVASRCQGCIIAVAESPPARDHTNQAVNPMHIERPTAWAQWSGFFLSVCCLLSVFLFGPPPATAAGLGYALLTSPRGDGAPRKLPPRFVEDLADLDVRREYATQPRLRVYTVVAGDTVSGIAKRFGLDIDTIRWSNPDLERNPDYLRLGTEVTILPVRGVYYQIQAGDTLEKIASRYGVDTASILEYPLNRLQSGDSLPAGRWIIIPHGTKQLVRPKPSLAPGYLFAWPIVGSITQGYGGKHRAIDIGAPYGSPVYAARAGTVLSAGWAQTGYGYTVLINHGEGYQTLYSHLKGAWVSQGQRVARGQLIGEVGSTGNSTGPHVHFEIRVNGVRSSPLASLPPSK